MLIEGEKSQLNQLTLYVSRTAGAAALTTIPAMPSATPAYAPAMPMTSLGARMGPWKTSIA